MGYSLSSLKINTGFEFHIKKFSLFPVPKLNLRNQSWHFEMQIVNYFDRNNSLQYCDVPGYLSMVHGVKMPFLKVVFSLSI